MSEKVNTSPSCTRCKKELLTHLQFHSLKSVGASGSLEIDCHPEPHGKVGDALKYVLETRATALVAQADLKAAVKKFATDLQTKVAEAERRLASEAQTKAAAKVAEELAAKEAAHKQALADCEKTRVEAQSAHLAKVAHLEDVLKEVRGDKQTLLDEKQALAGKLTASEKVVFDLRLEVGELKEELIEERRQHEDLKREAAEVLRLAFTVGKHAKTIGRKLGVDSESDLRKLFAKPADPRPPIVVEDPARKTPEPVIVMPPPVPTPAHKAEVVATRAAVPEAAPAPAPQTVTVMLDAPTPEPDASASADEEVEDDEADDDEVGDGDVVDEMEAGSDESDDVSFEEEGSSADDDASSDEAAAEECRGCDKAATHGFTFTTKDGKRERMTTCNPRKHVPDFLQHLQDEAAADPEGVLKTMPRTAGQLVALLKANPINPNS